MHVAKGVTTHGFAVNVDNDLTPFSWVVACGLPSVTMTSIALESGAPPAGGEAAGNQTGGASGILDAAGASVSCGPASPRIICFRKRAAFALAQALGHRQRLVTRERLESLVAADVVGAVGTLH